MAQERKRRPLGHGFQQQRDRERIYARSRGSDSPNWRKEPPLSPPQPTHHHPHLPYTPSHKDNVIFLHQRWTKFLQEKTPLDRPSTSVEVTPEQRSSPDQSHPCIDARLQTEGQS